MDEFMDKYALTGKFLVATPSLNDGGCFERSVVYICSHTKRGALGLIINKPLQKYTFSDLTFQMPLKNYEKFNEISLYAGGPLEQARGMVLHSADYSKNGTLLISNDIAVSSTTEIISDIAFDQGPVDKLVALGYSLWEPRQLESEIMNNDWLIVDADRDILFHTKDDEKWQRAVDSCGVNLNNFIAITGHS